MKRRKRAKVSKTRKAKVLQQDRRKRRGERCLCSCARQQRGLNVRVRLLKEKGIAVQSVTALQLTKKSSFHKK